MGRQHRWLLVLQALSFALIAYSILKFATTATYLILFLIPISLYLVGLLVSLGSSTRAKRTSEVDHDLRVAEYAPAVYPSIDVLLPTAGEPLGVLANTYRHVADLAWPGDVTVLVLDDGARSEVRDLAVEHGFTYLVRPDRGHLKKAGNLKWGYDHSYGDFIVVFDADFAPRTDFLANTVPYFEEDAVGIVQTPQFFDARKGMHWLQRTAGATQELFYRWIQPARDRSNAAICVGSNAVYRRAGLIKSGGFAQIGHSEDVHTGVNLLKVGYHVRYVPILVAKGLCPDTPGGFLNQQYRWCTGSMSLLADPAFHANKNIGGRQRLCFWAGFLYYISTALNAFVAPLPGIVMAWVLPQYVFPHNSVWLVGALSLWLVVLPLVMKSRWRIDVLRVQMMYSFAHAVAIADMLTRRTKGWVATGAANSAAQAGRSTPLGATIGRVMKVYVAASQLALLVGIAQGTAHYGLGRFWAMWALAGISLYVHLPLLFVNTGGERLRVGSIVTGPVRAVRNAWPRRSHPASIESEPEAPAPRKFRPDIQGMRAIAVTLVVLYHAGVPHITGGYVGVDVFFVISGFLITSQLMREVDRTGRINFLGFYAGRARRLLPPAAVVVIATLIFARLYESIFNVRSITTDAIYSAVYALNYRLAAKGVDYQHASDAVSPLQHLWSLAVEEQFYLFWPLIVIVVAVLARRYRWSALLAVTIGLIGVSLYLSIVVTVSNPPYAYFSLHTRAWQLMAGAVLAIGASRINRLPAWMYVLASWSGLALIIGSALKYNDSTAFPGKAAIVPVAGAMLVIIGGAHKQRRGAERLLGVRSMQGIGKVSYSWYLWHWPMVVLIPIAAGKTFDWQLKLEIMVLALWFAVLTLYLVENTALHSRLRRALWLPLGLSFGGATVACAILVANSIPSLIGSGQAATLASGGGASAIQAELINALSVKDAPANLTPSIKHAPNDFPASSNNGCHANFLQVDQGACVYGDPNGTHTLVMFGDSHMQQWLPALDAEGKTLGWKVINWTKSACPVADLPAEFNSDIGRSYTECPKWRDATEKKIEALHPSVLIMSQSDQLIGQVTNAKWGNATAITADHFKALNIPVIYLMDTARPETSNPQCIADHISAVGTCNFTMKDAFGPTNSVFVGRRDVLSRILKSQGITTFDPVPYLCVNSAKPEANACPAIVGNMMVYRDDSHMSTTYAAYLAPVTAPLFPGNTGAVPSLADPFAGTATGGETVPSVLQAGTDLPHYPANCIVSTLSTTSPECLIAPNGAILSTPVTSNRVVMIGDSHSGQWFDPIQSIAAGKGWDTEVLNKSSCPLSTTTVVNPELKRKFTECDTWRANALQRLASEPKPQVIFISQLNHYDNTGAQWDATLDKLKAIGAPIVYLQDTPDPANVPACIASNINDWAKCSFKPGSAIFPDVLATSDRGLAAVISVNQYLCPTGGATCPAVRDGVLLYRDASGHVSRTAMMRLAPAIHKELIDAKIITAS